MWIFRFLVVCLIQWIKMWIIYYFSIILYEKILHFLLYMSLLSCLYFSFFFLFLFFFFLIHHLLSCTDSVYREKMWVFLYFLNLKIFCRSAYFLLISYACAEFLIEISHSIRLWSQINLAYHVQQFMIKSRLWSQISLACHIQQFMIKSRLWSQISLACHVW